MVTITVLRAQPAPKQITAVPHSDSLKSHLMAFLNANNPTGFLAPEVAGEVLQMLMDLSKRDTLSLDELKSHATLLKQITNRRIKQCRAFEMISRLFGYRAYRDARAASLLTHGLVTNLCYGEEINVDVLQDDEGDSPLGVVRHATLVTKEVGVWDEFRTDGLMALPHRFATGFRFAHLELDSERFVAIALKRFFGLKRRQQLYDYRVRQEFPPGFHPDRVNRREHQLSNTIGGRPRSYTALSAFLELRPWCVDEAMQLKLEQTIGELANGNPNRSAVFVRRDFGAITLLIGDTAGIGLVTENEKLTELIVMRAPTDAGKGTVHG